jgi:hypothetical protein
MKPVSWTDLLGNPYRYGLHFRMLLPDGYDYVTAARISGQSKIEKKIAVIIHFDEEYVIEYIRKMVLEKLKPAVEFEKFDQIINEAWRRQQKIEQEAILQ